MRYFRFRVRVFGCRRAGTGAARRDGPSVRVGRLGLSGCFVAYRHSGRISPSFRKLSARCVRSGPPYSVPRPFGGGRRSAPERNSGCGAARTGSGLESRDNGKYGCPGHKGRVMNMRWGRFGSINICLLIDWCNEPTKKFRLARAACLLVGSARRESRPAVARSGLRGRSFRSCRVGIQNFYVAV